MEHLLAVPEPAQQEAEPDDSVAHDHDRGEYRIARQRRLGVAEGEHQRDDQRDFDHRDRNREHQRAIRLADAVRDDFGVMDGGEHGAGKTGGDDDTGTGPPTPSPSRSIAPPTPRCGMSQVQ